jgi:hypothetical protein
MKHWILTFALGCAAVMAPALGWAAGNDARDITAAMKKQFDRPDAPLVVAPVTVVGDYAVAGWTQTGKGGRALLQKDKHQWVISVCAGDGLTKADVLQTTGMTAANADKLSKAVTAAESKLGKDKLKLFASFEGMVKIDAAAGHGEHGAHGAHAAPAAHGAHDAHVKK